MRGCHCFGVTCDCRHLHEVCGCVILVHSSSWCNIDWCVGDLDEQSLVERHEIKSMVVNML